MKFANTLQCCTQKQEYREDSDEFQQRRTEGNILMNQ